MCDSRVLPRVPPASPLFMTPVHPPSTRLQLTPSAGPHLREDHRCWPHWCPALLTFPLATVFRPILTRETKGRCVNGCCLSSKLSHDTPLPTNQLPCVLQVTPPKCKKIWALFSFLSLCIRAYSLIMYTSILIPLLPTSHNTIAPLPGHTTGMLPLCT